VRNQGARGQGRRRVQAAAERLVEVGVKATARGLDEARSYADEQRVSGRWRSASMGWPQTGSEREATLIWCGSA